MPRMAEKTFAAGKHRGAFSYFRPRFCIYLRSCWRTKYSNNMPWQKWQKIYLFWLNKERQMQSPVGLGHLTKG